MALVTGLRIMLADPGTDLSWSDAGAALHQHVTRQIEAAGRREIAS